jgi:hypothetical protein
MRTRPFALAALAGVVCLFGSAGPTLGQSGPISIVTNNQITTQNFDTLPTSGTTNPFASFDQASTTLAGFFAVQTGGSAAAGPVSVIRAGDGASNAGNIYSFGTGTATERALGSAASGTPGNFGYGVVFQNNTADSLTVNVAYTGEQWRNGGNVAVQYLSFSYAVGNTPPTTAALTTSLATSTFTPEPSTAPTGFNRVTALDFASPITGATAAALDGNAAANRTTLTAQLATGGNAATVAAGQYLTLFWIDPNSGGNDHGLGIDDLSVTFAVAPVPEPTAVLGLAAAGLGLARVVRRRATV